MFTKHKNCSYLCLHPVCSMLIGAAAATATLLALYAVRGRLSMAARAAEKCLSTCMQAEKTMVKEMKDSMTGECCRD